MNDRERQYDLAKDLYDYVFETNELTNWSKFLTLKQGIFPPLSDFLRRYHIRDLFRSL